MLGRCWKMPSESWSVALIWLTRLDSCSVVAIAMIWPRWLMPSWWPSSTTAHAFLTCDALRPLMGGSGAVSGLTVGFGRTGFDVTFGLGAGVLGAEGFGVTFGATLGVAEGVDPGVGCA